MSDVAPPEPTATCPGCGTVLVRTVDDAPAHPGASVACTRLFETTLRGLREEADTDAAAAATVGLADAAYDAQHPIPADPTRAADAVARLAGAVGISDDTGSRARPRVWRTTIADVAADLDVIDLPVLVQAWARSVHQDWLAVARDL